MIDMMKLIVIALLLSTTSGCAVIITSAGGGATAVQVATVLDAAKLGGDVISGATTGKTLTDHAISYAVDRDCSLWYPIQGWDICNDIAEEQDADVEAPQ